MNSLIGSRMNDAIRTGDLTAIQEIFTITGSNPNYSYGKYHGTILHMAAVAGNLEACAFAISMGAAVNSIDDFYYAPLIHAAFAGHARVCRFLLENGADVNASNYNGWSVIHAATYSCNPECVRVILEAGANPNSSNRLNWSPLHVILGCHEGEKFTPMRERSLEILRMLLEAGANPNSVNIHGDTAIHLAFKHSRNGFEHAFELVKHGGDPRAKTRDEFYPVAMERHEPGFMRELYDLYNTVRVLEDRSE